MLMQDLFSPSLMFKECSLPLNHGCVNNLFVLSLLSLFLLYLCHPGEGCTRDAVHNSGFLQVAGEGDLLPSGKLGWSLRKAREEKVLLLLSLGKWMLQKGKTMVESVEYLIPRGHANVWHADNCGQVHWSPFPSQQTRLVSWMPISVKKQLF